jgi:hypothetical protein
MCSGTTQVDVGFVTSSKSVFQNPGASYSVAGGKQAVFGKRFSVGAVVALTSVWDNGLGLGKENDS